MSAGNMLRSLVPLVLICLALVGWMAFRTSGQDPVREVDPTTTISLAAARAGYPLVAPEGLPEGYRPTSARTDAGEAGDGDPVTLEIGYLTPSQEFAGFVISDDPRAAPVTDVLGDATDGGTLDVDGQTWTRSTTADGETALSRELDGATVLVTGSAPDEELAEVAAAVAPVAS
jgi:Protein of unknown function (DUF4245)